MSTVKKRGPGRPRLHKETTLLTFRVPVEVATLLKGAISTILLASQEPHTPFPVVLIDAFRGRLKQLYNMRPDEVDKALRRLDRAMSHYEHIKR
jgi:hypothetical protein